MAVVRGDARARDAGAGTAAGDGAEAEEAEGEPALTNKDFFWDWEG